eukprot:Selendium_serpulae@DN5647_c0_g1_i1.p1
MVSRGFKGWSSAHEKEFGKERWQGSLLPALCAPIRHVCVVPRASLPHAAEGADEVGSFVIENCFVPTAASEKFLEDTSRNHHVQYMDGGSVMSALLLGSRKGDKILDMCSAPGNKALIISGQLFEESVFDSNEEKGLEGVEIRKPTSHLCCCEVSRPRFSRLQKMLKEGLTPEIYNSAQVSILCADSRTSTAVDRGAPYHRVLIDAPCSTDRHLLHEGDAGFAEWSSGTPKRHAQLQVELIASAISRLAPGGTLLYATCALSPKENDQVCGMQIGLHRVHNRVSTGGRKSNQDVERKTGPRPCRSRGHGSQTGDLSGATRKFGRGGRQESNYCRIHKEWHSDSS